MKTIYMKIHSFDEASYSLLASFASDTTKYQDPDKYPSYAFQPMNMWPDVSDPDEIKKRIAIAGIWHAEQQEREEQFIADPTKVAEYKAMVGNENSYPVSSLIPPAPVPQDNEPAPILEV